VALGGDQAGCRACKSRVPAAQPPTTFYDEQEVRDGHTPQMCRETMATTAQNRAIRIERKRRHFLASLKALVTAAANRPSCQSPLAVARQDE